MNFEILAPAGSMESVIAGVRSGADAIYLGGKSFNARRNAGNFDDEELKNAVSYCHLRNCKVYLTINTLVSDNEMRNALDVAKHAMECGIDGFIIQDIGLAKLIHQYLPQAHLHASTQMSVMSPAGFKALEEMGFCRAVLPREMSMDEIKEIRKATSMELEIFVHGALCMSISGQCYLSSMIGSRSGNRGLCAQPCRLPFSADNSNSCDLSLKDLSLINRLKEIDECGVFSLKIEGRMKRPEYVAASVTAIKKAICNEYTNEDENRLQSVFSRSGFTDGYFTGKRLDMFGTRRKEDVVAANNVLKEFSHIYDNEVQRVPLTMEFSCKENQNATLTATALNKTVSVIGAVAQKAINKPMTDASLTERLSKLGGTQYFATDIKIDIDEGLILPASEINKMRRDVCERLNISEETSVISNEVHLIKARSEKAVPYYTARFSSPEQIPQSHPFMRIFLPIWCDENDFVKYDAGVELPRGLFGVENKIKEKLSILKNKGVKNALCCNLGSLKLAKDMGFNTFGDFGLNVYNSQSANEISSPILSFELTLENANAINANDTGIIVYGYVPLMLTRNCPIKNHIGCEKCKKNGKLTDRKGYEFSISCSPYPCVELLNTVPIYMGDRMREVKTDFAHFYFSKESNEEVERIIKMFAHNEKPNFKYTRGLYQRGAL